MNAENTGEASDNRSEASVTEPEPSATESYDRAELLMEERISPDSTLRDYFKYRRLDSERKSLIAGISGLGAITLLLGVAVPIEVYLLNEFDVGKPTYIWMMILFQSLLLPPMIGFSFTAVTPMFWYGSITVRFVMATAAVLPACFGFVIALTKIENGTPSGFVHSFSLVMFTSLMTIATVALTVQLWSRWTLSHTRPDVTALPPTGIGSMIELTGVAAVGCAFFMSNDFFEYLEGMLLFGGISFMAAIAIIITQITFLRDGPRSRNAKICGFLFAFAAAFVLNGFFAVTEYGWNALTGGWNFISAASLYGALLTCGVMWVCLRWLRFCGWQCIDRRNPQRSLQPTSTLANEY